MFFSQKNLYVKQYYLYIVLHIDTRFTTHIGLFLFNNIIILLNS
jgi:hypothetical protein